MKVLIQSVSQTLYCKHTQHQEEEEWTQ